MNLCFLLPRDFWLKSLHGNTRPRRESGGPKGRHVGSPGTHRISAGGHVVHGVVVVLNQLGCKLIQRL